MIFIENRMFFLLPSIFSAIDEASLASPIKTGQIGWFSPKIVNPALVIASRNCFVLLATFCVRSDEVMSKSNTYKLTHLNGFRELNYICKSKLFNFQISNKSTFELEATTGGGKLFENRYGLDFCLNRSTISLGPVVYPPAAPPSALPSVELIMSTGVLHPKYSSVPRPVFPKKPVA